MLDRSKKFKKKTKKTTYLPQRSRRRQAPHLEHLSFVVLDETSVRQGEARPVIRSHGIDWMHGIDDRDPTFLGGGSNTWNAKQVSYFF